MNTSRCARRAAEALAVRDPSDVAPALRPFPEMAFRIRWLGLVRWPTPDYGLSEFPAHRLLGRTDEAPLAQVCDTTHT